MAERPPRLYDHAMEGSQATAAGPGSGPPATIADVIARMTAIEAALEPEDGVARFNDLYLAVTREVAKEAAGETFEDAEFLARLDVVFAERYFTAVDGDEGSQSVPRAWAPLFEARGRAKIAPIQFALAGMNSHINYDLCLALVATCRELALGFELGSPQHRDYLKVNAILERVEAEVKERFSTGLVGVADEALGRIDDVVAIWSVARARDSAWTQAQTLATLQAIPDIADKYLAGLGRIVGLAGRGLLIATL